VIIDTDSLIHLTAINKEIPIFSLLRKIFLKIHVPEEVFKEYCSGSKIDVERLNIINLIEGYNPFWQLCTSYESISLEFYKTTKGIDKGEAEAAAQHLKIHSRFIISDDASFHKSILSLDKSVCLLKTIHVLSIVDIHGYLGINWEKSICLLHKSRRFTSKEFRKCYKEVSEIYSIPATNKKLSEKTSLKKFGLK
jgi:predicted nucleic acid-binding protein